MTVVKGGINGVEMSRHWSMPSANTLTILPILKLVGRYIRGSKLSLDPFARNCSVCDITNDLNENTSAMFNMFALDFLKTIVSNGITADLVIFDPPFSPRQIKECYESIGLKMAQSDALMTNWKKERDVINDILSPDGYVISFGWNSNGMGIKRQFKIIELMLVSHGAGHNDTIVTVENRITRRLI